MRCEVSGVCVEFGNQVEGASDVRQTDIRFGCRLISRKGDMPEKLRNNFHDRSDAV